MMRTVVVRYRVKPDRVAENEELVRAVYAELASTKPDGLRYATFRLDGGGVFMHLAEVQGEQNPLDSLASFARFQEGIGARCDEPPQVSTLETVGSYRLLEALEGAPV
jgi:hypothetical protein